MQRCIAVIVQPCILCEADMEEWHVYLDEETSIESVIVEPLEHLCPGMSRLLRERAASPHQRRL